MLERVREGELWLADRSFSTSRILCAVDEKRAAFIIRERGLAFDYIPARQELSEEHQRVLDVLANQVSSSGEPFRLFLSSEEWKAELTRVGLGEVEDLDGPALHARYFAQRGDGLGTLRGGPGNLRSAWVREP